MEIKGNVARFLQSNTDTDVIIPAKFLKRTALDGFEQFSFYEKKYEAGTICEPSIEEKDYVFDSATTVLNKDCTLNHPNSKDASFLLTWENFGCGSSREHAVYALKGFKVVIGSAPAGKSAFADIFRDNCRQNLIWTPVVSEEDFKTLNNYIEKEIDHSSIELTLDIENKKIRSADGAVEVDYQLPEAHEKYLLAGLDAFAKAKIEIDKNLEIISKWEDSNKTLLAASPNSKN